MYREGLLGGQPQNDSLRLTPIPDLHLGLIAEDSYVLHPPFLVRIFLECFDLRGYSLWCN
jgi:hypothetical protein